ncbi:UDP-N-acetylmuramoyl-L-alanine--D-glutamate ligase [Nocardioides mesophilus]|uniref:UDP-N-acetylmuramoylalanine--D-glutamate ligase n=1 Tax=Nocardioides mesophilus TaxID=433659 RepID=A0A7G9RBW7_9ACTN|nr:UDP-N-acetylmuramoyl-L-alanine--D-glutamate ligase [Nocardioides mesophilus]QNN53092.1 UDP-N-acetylmuramoyl-L-alanine--D-glutamate ligase [Nocardioides mesophilus]
MSALEHLGRHDSWEAVRAVVVGVGVSGFAAADNLLHVGAHVRVLAESATPAQLEQAHLLEVLGADVRIGPGATSADALPDDVQLVVTSPGVPPTAPLLAAAYARGLPVWGEVELAWRLRDPEHPGTWLCVTGTNGKTTTVQMLAAILAAAGVSHVTCGNVGLPIVEAVMDPTPYDVYAVELSSFQLHYTHTMAAGAAAVLNVAEDHLDWYTGPHGMADYAADKGRIYERVSTACIYNVADPVTEQLVRDADVEEGARAIGFTLGTPGVGMVGLVEDVLADRAFIEDRASTAAELCTIADLASPAPHYVANALAAAALARSYGVPAAAVRDGLSAFRPDGHRIAEVALVDGVRYVDDSKATNPHAARSSLQAYDPVVWVAGGLAKGAGFDDLVTAVRDRLRGVVLLGRDRGVIADALARHAPDVRVIEVDDGDTSVMDRVVGAAADLAQPGDTVLLAPGCASMDMFANYGARGDAFAESVHRLRDR